MNMVLLTIIAVVTTLSIIVLSSSSSSLILALTWPSDFNAPQQLTIENRQISERLFIEQNPASVNNDDYFNSVLIFRNVIFKDAVVTSPTKRVLLKGTEKIIFDNCEFQYTLTIQTLFLSDNATIEVKNSNFTGDYRMPDESKVLLSLDLKIEEPQLFNASFIPTTFTEEAPPATTAANQLGRPTDARLQGVNTSFVKYPNFWQQTTILTPYQQQYPSVIVENNTFFFNNTQTGDLGVEWQNDRTWVLLQNVSTRIHISRASFTAPDLYSIPDAPLQFGSLVFTKNTIRAGNRLPLFLYCAFYFEQSSIFGNRLSSTLNAQAHLFDVSNNSFTFVGTDEGMKDALQPFLSRQFYNRPKAPRDRWLTVFMTSFPNGVQQLNTSDPLSYFRPFGMSIKRILINNNHFDFGEITSIFHFHMLHIGNGAGGIDKCELISVCNNTLVKNAYRSSNLVQYSDEYLMDQQNYDSYYFQMRDTFFIRFVSLGLRDVREVHVDNNHATGSFSRLFVVQANFFGGTEVTGVINVKLLTFNNNSVFSRFFSRITVVSLVFTYLTTNVEVIEMNNNVMDTDCFNDDAQYAFEAASTYRPDGKVLVNREFCRLQLVDYSLGLECGVNRYSQQQLVGTKRISINNNHFKNVVGGRAAMAIVVALYPAFPNVGWFTEEEKEYYSPENFQPTLEISHNHIDRLEQVADSELGKARVVPDSGFPVPAFVDVYTLGIQIQMGVDVWQLIHIHHNFFNNISTGCAGNARAISILPRWSGGLQYPYANTFEDVKNMYLKDTVIENNIIIMRKYRTSGVDGIFNTITFWGFVESNTTVRGNITIRNNNLDVSFYNRGTNPGSSGILVTGAEGDLFPSVFIYNNTVAMSDVFLRGGTYFAIGIGSPLFTLSPNLFLNRLESAAQSLHFYIDRLVISNNTISVKSIDRSSAIRILVTGKMNIFESVMIENNIADTGLSSDCGFLDIGHRFDSAYAELLGNPPRFYNALLEGRLAGRDTEVIAKEERMNAFIMSRQNNNNNNNNNNNLNISVVDNIIKGTNQLFSLNISLGSPQYPVNIHITGNTITSHRWTEALKNNASMANDNPDFIFSSRLIFLSSDWNQAAEGTNRAYVSVPTTTISSFVFKNTKFDIEGFCTDSFSVDIPFATGDHRPIHIQNGILLATKGIASGTNGNQQGLTRTVRLDRLEIDNVSGVLKCIDLSNSGPVLNRISNQRKRSMLQNVGKSVSVFSFDDIQAPKVMNVSRVSIRVGVLDETTGGFLTRNSANNNNAIEDKIVPSYFLDFSDVFVRQQQVQTSTTTPPSFSLLSSNSFESFVELLPPVTSSPSSDDETIMNRFVKVGSGINNNNDQTRQISGGLLQVYLGCFDWNAEVMSSYNPFIERSNIRDDAREDVIRAECTERPVPSVSPSQSQSQNTLSISENTQSVSEHIVEKKQVYRPSSAVMSTITVLGSIMSVAAMGAIQTVRKVDAFGDLRLCGNTSEFDHLEFDSNPLFIRIGPNTDRPLATYVGSALGSFGVIAIAFFVMIIVVLVIFKYRLVQNEKKNRSLAYNNHSSNSRRRSSAATAFAKKSFFQQVSSMVMKNNDNDNEGKPRSHNSSRRQSLSMNNPTPPPSSNNNNNKEQKEIWQMTVRNLRMPSVISLVVIIVAFPSISSAGTVFSFSPESAKGKRIGIERTVLDIVLATPAVIFYFFICGYYLYRTCVGIEKAGVKLNRPIPLEGSWRAEKAQKKYEKEFYESQEREISIRLGQQRREQEKRKKSNENNKSRSSSSSRRKEQSSSKETTPPVLLTYEEMKESMEKPKILPTAPKYTFFIWKIWQWFNHPWTEWDGDNPWMKNHGVVVEPFAWQWFIFVDYYVGLSVAILVGSSLACETNGCCIGVASSCLVSSIVHTVLLFWKRPQHHKFDVMFNFTLSILALCIVTLTLVELVVANPILLSTEEGDPRRDPVLIIAFVNDLFSQAAIIVSFANMAAAFMPIVIIPAAEFLIEQWEEYQKKKNKTNNTSSGGKKKQIGGGSRARHQDDDDNDDDDEMLLVGRNNNERGGDRKSKRVNSRRNRSNNKNDTDKQANNEDDDEDEPSDLLTRSKSGRKWQLKLEEPNKVNSAKPFSSTRETNNNNRSSNKGNLSQMLLSPVDRASKNNKNRFEDDDPYEKRSSSTRNNNSHRRTSSREDYHHNHNHHHHHHHHHDHRQSTPSSRHHQNNNNNTSRRKSYHEYIADQKDYNNNSDQNQDDNYYDSSRSRRRSSATSDQPNRFASALDTYRFPLSTSLNDDNDGEADNSNNKYSSSKRNERRNSGGGRKDHHRREEEHRQRDNDHHRGGYRQYHQERRSSSRPYYPDVDEHDRDRDRGRSKSRVKESNIDDDNENEMTSFLRGSVGTRSRDDTTNNKNKTSSSSRSSRPGTSSDRRRYSDPDGDNRHNRHHEAEAAVLPRRHRKRFDDI